MRQFLTLVLLLILISINNVVFSEVENKNQIQKEIINRLQKWPTDFNTKNIPEICSLFAPDLIAGYPGTKDRNYEEMCLHFKTILSDPNKVFSYESPKIEQILIDKDTAVVRLTWTLKITYKNQSDSDLIKEKGLDIFRRQKDGSWKIAISYAYPENN